MSGFQFHDPAWFLALLPLAFLAWWRLRRRPGGLVFTAPEAIDRLAISWTVRIRQGLFALQLIAWILLVAVLARPQQGLEEYRVRTEGIAIEMCLDRSGSMRATDFMVDGEVVNRLQAVKQVFADFVLGTDDLPGRPDDLVGLVAFGGFAESLCPLTLDHGALSDIVQQVQLPEPIRDAQGRIINRELLLQEQATAIGDAVALGVERLKDASAKSKVLILLSDGENNAGVVTPEQAADAAAAYGVKIYSIGVGSNAEALLRRMDPFGMTLMQPQQFNLDEATLRMLAEKTDGVYFRANDTESLQQVYEAIDQLEKTQTEGLTYRRHAELFAPLLWVALTLLLLEFLLSHTWFLTVP